MIENADLQFCINKIYLPAHLYLTKVAEKDSNTKSAPYGGHTLYLNDKKVLFRVAKITDTRPGAFVTLWKKTVQHDRNVPFDASDGIDFLVVFVKGESVGEENGQFIFDKSLLLQKNIISREGMGGKRAMRVFPPWSERMAELSIKSTRQKGLPIQPTLRMSAASKKTQKWQARYWLPYSKRTQEEMLQQIKALLY